MPDYLQKKKTEQKTIQTTVQAQKSSKKLMPVQNSKTKVIGRSELNAPIPRAAVEKSVTNSIKSFFHIGKSKKKQMLNVSAPDDQNAVQDVKVRHEAAVDLTEAERISKSDIEKESVWNSYKELAENIISSDEYNGYPEKVQNIVNKLKDISVAHQNEEVRYSLEMELGEEIKTELAPRKAEMDRDLATLEGIADEAQKEAFSKEIEGKYKDVEVMTMISTVLFSNLRGNLDVEGLDKKAKFLNCEDDWFLESKQLKKEKHDLQNNVYDTKVVYFPKTNDYSDQPLFSSEPAMEDVAQGNVGDCFLISSLAVITGKNPDFIKNCMKDEGKTVVVRFFSGKDGKPVYVRVNKTVPARGYRGRDNKSLYKNSEKEIGAKNVLWVKMFEKAYAVFVSHERKHGSDEFKRYMKNTITGSPNGMKILDAGQQSYFLEMFTGKKYDQEFLMGGPNVLIYQKATKISELFKAVRKSNKTDGIFKNNVIFNKYEKYLKSFMKKNFDSFNRDEFGFVNMVDLDMFISNIDINDMPQLNLGDGVDELELRKQYLDYFRKSVLESGLLRNTINTTGEYSDNEKNLYDKIDRAARANKIMTANVLGHALHAKKGAGANGEAVVFGVASSHGYGVLGVVEKEVTIGKNKVMQRFVRVVNPWKNHKVRLYDKDTFLPYMADEKKEDGSVYDARGEFLMEFRDFYYTFGNLLTEK
ncbi:MAG: hypothetical protein K6F99_03825 [Lachnospiraceae bacterium]|nr:hypothetical protein [Lachnospiraceae bacterium]